MVRKVWMLVSALVVFSPIPAAAQQVQFQGQVRPRYEYRDPVGADRDDFISMRVRAGLTSALADNVSVLLQFQDVRLWGEETNPLRDFRADNFDLHQGYVTVSAIGGNALAVRAGRQEMVLSEERLLGSVDWTQQGQAFDGVRVMAEPEGFKVDAFAFKLGEDTSDSDDSGWFLGGQGTFTVGNGALDLYGFFERMRGTASTNQGTAGARWAFTSGSLNARLEGSYQFGDRADQDVAAFMLGASAALRVNDRATVTLWYDYLSGDDDPDDGEVGVFSTLYATNHKFYGFADLFLNIPAHTQGRGLQDLAIKGSLSATERTTLLLDLHTFRVAERGTLADAHLGEEIDFTLRHRVRSPLMLIGGLSYVLQDDALATIGRLDEDLVFGYVMLNVSF